MRMLISLISSFALACVAVAQTPPPNRKGPPAGQFSQPHGHAVGKSTTTGKPTITGYPQGAGKQNRAGKGKPITTPVPAYNATHTTGKSAAPAKTQTPPARVRSTPAVTPTPTGTPLTGPQGPTGSPTPTLNNAIVGGGGGGAGVSTPTPAPTLNNAIIGGAGGAVGLTPTPTPTQQSFPQAWFPTVQTPTPTQQTFTQTMIAPTQAPSGTTTQPLDVVSFTSKSGIFNPVTIIPPTPAPAPTAAGINTLFWNDGLWYNPQNAPYMYNNLSQGYTDQYGVWHHGP